MSGVFLPTDDLNQLIEQSINKAFKTFTESFKPSSEPELMTRKEASQYLNINLSTLNTWTKKGVLTSYGIEGRIFYKRQDIEDALIKMN